MHHKSGHDNNNNNNKMIGLCRLVKMCGQKKKVGRMANHNTLQSIHPGSICDDAIKNTK